MMPEQTNFADEPSSWQQIEGMFWRMAGAFALGCALGLGGLSLWCFYGVN